MERQKWLHLTELGSEAQGKWCYVQKRTKKSVRVRRLQTTFTYSDVVKAIARVNRKFQTVKREVRHAINNSLAQRSH